MFRTHAMRPYKKRRTNDLSGVILWFFRFLLFKKILTGSAIGFG